MLKTIKIKIRHWIKKRLDLYDIEDLQAGGNCGCCGKWVPDMIVPVLWSWCLCNSCGKVNNIDMKKLRKKMNEDK